MLSYVNMHVLQMYVNTLATDGEGKDLPMIISVSVTCLVVAILVVMIIVAFLVILKRQLDQKCKSCTHSHAICDVSMHVGYIIILGGVHYTHNISYFYICLLIMLDMHNYNFMFKIVEIHDCAKKRAVTSCKTSQYNYVDATNFLSILMFKMVIFPDLPYIALVLAYPLSCEFCLVLCAATTKKPAK